MKPTENQINSLPKWAKDHIRNLEREREAAIRCLNQFQDEQTPSDFWFEDMICSGEDIGPVSKTRYIQTNSIHVAAEGVHVEIAALRGKVQCRRGIEIRWGSAEQNHIGDHIACIPESFQQIRLLARDQMNVR